jgi:hypothetical protein
MNDTNLIPESQALRAFTDKHGMMRHASFLFWNRKLVPKSGGRVEANWGRPLPIHKARSLHNFLRSLIWGSMRRTGELEVSGDPAAAVSAVPSKVADTLSSDLHRNAIW